MRASQAREYLRQCLRLPASPDGGQDLIEYVILVAFLITVVIVGLAVVNRSISHVWVSVGDWFGALAARGR